MDNGKHFQSLRKLWIILHQIEIRCGRDARDGDPLPGQIAPLAHPKSPNLLTLPEQVLCVSRFLRGLWRIETVP